MEYEGEDISYDLLAATLANYRPVIQILKIQKLEFL